MKDEIKEILEGIEVVIKYDGTLEFNAKELKILLDYITNLQEKSNNQAEEINRLYKQREKFMKKYDYLQEEKDKYKNVIDKIKKEVLTELQMCKPKEMAISMEIYYIEEKLEKLLEKVE